MGWLAVLLYFSAAVSCWITARKLRLAAADAADAKEQRVWRSLTVAFLALGINKQLELQTALTEAVRVFARFHDWYGQRRLVQVAFVAVVAVACVVVAIMLARWARKAPAPTRVALAISIALIGYVLIRAASLHQFDRLIYADVLGFRLNWILEMGGIGAVLVASYWRQSTIGKSDPGLLQRN